MQAHSTVDEILLPEKIRRCLATDFPEYEYKKYSGFQLRVFKDKEGEVAVRVIYRITGQAENRFDGKNKRNAKIRNLREYTQLLLASGFDLSPDFKSNGKASYFKRDSSLLKSRMDSFEALQQHSLLAADGQNINDLENLYLVTSFWYGKKRPEFRLRSMRYGVELRDTFTPIEAANYGYRVIGTLSDERVEFMYKWWSSSDKVILTIHDLLPKGHQKKNYRSWRKQNIRNKRVKISLKQWKGKHE